MMRKVLLGASLLVVASSSFAITPGDGSDTNTSDFRFVGTVNGASGVLIGSNWVLTAKHVGAGTFTLPGIGTFAQVGAAIDHPTDDLTLFRIDSNLSDYATIDVSGTSLGSLITMVGFGSSGSLNANADGYDINLASGIRRKATGLIEGTAFIDSPGIRAYSLVAPLRQNGQGAIAGGDSGGGWFTGSNRLVGINSWIGTFGNFNDNYRFSSDSENFFASGAVDLSKYKSWFQENNVAVVPEPSTMTCFAMASLVLVRRKFKLQSKK